ncbi:phage tail protein [Pseudomonas protegens]|uniref:phage tail protein n=1 Tax=Pseudomonas protegens TaxID=380021 RepID=UPI00276EE910|nr:phage tail protein [Pseudomonas protegens]MDP9534496.1 phage tail protein [Pseudomonas protegens]
MDYPKSVPSVGLVNGKFVDENPVTGQVGSLISSQWGNAVTDELLNVIRAGGKVPAEAEHDQLLAAIKAIVRDSIPPEKIRTTLAEYGITDAYTKSVTYTKAEIEALLKNMSALPVGAMVPFPKGTVPPGFLEVDGSVQSAATYPDLAAYLGTTFNTGGEGAGNFRLPESRGEFLRGWDHGRGVDSGRAIGSWQKGSISSRDADNNGFTASVYLGGNSSTTAEDFGLDKFSLSGASYVNAQLAYASGGSALTRDDVYLGVTRPRNLAVMWCIKAWNAPVNQGNIDIASLAANVAALEARPRGLGDGQIWQNLTTSRVSGTVYTNTTGRPIQVHVAISSGAVYARVGPVDVSFSAYHATFVVPAGATYTVTLNNPVNLCWSELRT